MREREKKIGQFSRRGSEMKGTEGGDKYLNGPQMKRA